MKAKTVKTIIGAGVLTLVALVLFSLIVAAAAVPTAPVAAAQGRQFAIMHLDHPNVEGPYSHPGLPPGGIKVIDLDLSTTGSPYSGDPNDPWSIRPQFSEVTVTKEFDQASPDLSFYCAVGQHFRYVYIRLLPVTQEPYPNPPTEEPYYEIILEDAVITKVADRMVYRENENYNYAHLEEVCFKYSRIIWSDIGSGKVRSWDLVNNTGI